MSIKIKTISTLALLMVGMAATPPRFLKAGDSVTIEIEKIGSLTNPVIEEALKI